MTRVINSEESLGVTVQLPDGNGLRFRDVLRGEVVEPPAVGNLKHGLAPRGAKPDLASPEFSFPINTKLEVWADNLADLYEEGNARQWDATRDIRWGELPVLADDLELATAQLMTFLAENEFVAMYLPAKFIPRINPEFTEVVLVLAAQVKDEARHLEVFTKRALANGAGLQQVSPSTQWGLKSLLAQEDFSETSFLLHVLGEGTFMELLKFIENHAPDPVTKDIIRRVRQDEARHVGYGVQHAGYRISREPEAAARFLKATEARVSFVRATAGADVQVQRALAVLAGGGSSLEQLAHGEQAIRALYTDMHQKRITRMLRSGFSREMAMEISDLHGGGVQTFM